MYARVCVCFSCPSSYTVFLGFYLWPFWQTYCLFLFESKDDTFICKAKEKPLNVNMLENKIEIIYLAIAKETARTAEGDFQITIM